MKKVFFSLFVLMGLALGVSAQGASHEARSINAVRQECGNFYFQGNTWNITAVLEYETRCAYSEVITGPGEVWMVVASYNCTGEICPAIADMVIGRVTWCGNDIEAVECY
jgi:hypothetical protein